MGGTMSMLHWAMAFDPIVEGVSRACGVHAPTFVDDLAATTVGPRHTAATEVFLVAAAHCAGLLLEGHQCEWLECDLPVPAFTRALETLPVAITGGPVTFTIRGVRPDFARAVLEQQLGAHWATRVRVLRQPCRCGTKTAVVPQAALTRWQAALATSPFGASSVVPSWPYLGVAVASPGPTAPPPTRCLGHRQLGHNPR